MQAADGCASAKTAKAGKKEKNGERLLNSGRGSRRTAERTRYRTRFDSDRTYGGEEIDDDPAVCLHCTLPAQCCKGEYLCYIRHKQILDRRKATPAVRLLETWKPSGIYDIWGDSPEEDEP